MNKKYVDIPALCQIIGCIYNNPKILDKDDKYKFIEEDFCDNFHKIIFSSMFNIYQLGAKEISLAAIEDYLAPRPQQLAEYKVKKGAEYILQCAETANENTFNYYYNRMKKMTLLQAYEDVGMNMDFIYDVNNIFDSKKKQEQEDWLDNSSLETIANVINDKIDAIKVKFAEGADDNGEKLGDGALELIESLREAPSYGYPFYTEYMNTITRGMRLGRFYLRSAPTGAGKSRSMIADACYCGCSQIYNLETNMWESIGVAQPTLYIGTEQDSDEITTMALAFIAAVDEEHILTGSYYSGEYERVIKATQILQSGKVYFECIPDFTLQMIENTIKKYIREFNVQYCFYDYIHTSAAMLTEIGSKSGVKNIREDNLLFLLSTALKDLTVKYGIFILSSTQLNMAWTESTEPDQNCLRGSKAIADRLDVGMILLEATNEDKEKLKPLCNANGLPVPNMKLSIYKNRQGQHRGEYLWLAADKSCCRFKGLFLTRWDYSYIEAPNIKIKVEQPGAF